MQGRARLALLAATVAAALLPAATAHGAPGTAKVTLPSAGSVNVAYFLVRGPRPGQARAKFPKLGAASSPGGVVAAWKMKRVAGSKDRFHLLVVSIRSRSLAASRVAARTSAGALTLRLGAGYRVLRRGGASAIEGACQGPGHARVGAEQCNGPTVTGETGLFTLLSGDTLPRGGWSFGLYYNNWDRLLDLGEDLFLDRRADPAVAEALGVDLVQSMISAFPGRTDELVFATVWTIPDVDGLELDFGGLTPTNFLPPPAALCTPLGDRLSCIWQGGAPASPQVLNVRFSTAVDSLRGTIRATTDGGATWTEAFPLYGAYARPGGY